MNIEMMSGYYPNDPFLYLETQGAGTAGYMLIFLGVYYVLLTAISIGAYVLQSLGMYTVAKRRCIRHAWLAWLPLGNVWILGSISDQYQYVVKGRIHNRRKVLLGLTIALYALLILLYVEGIAAIMTAVSMNSVGVPIVSLLITFFILFVAAIVTVVIQYMADYDYYVSCEPDNAVLYLVLSIVFSVVRPIFFFVCRKKDLGMPPRKQTLQEQPAIEITEPVAQMEETCLAEKEELPE